MDFSKEFVSPVSEEEDVREYYDKEKGNFGLLIQIDT